MPMTDPFTWAAIGLPPFQSPVPREILPSPQPSLTTPARPRTLAPDHLTPRSPRPDLMPSNVRPESGLNGAESSRLTSLPASGSELYLLRLAALRAGQLYTRLPMDSFRAAWVRGSYKPTYEQWRWLLRREARVVARGQGHNRLGVLVGDSLSLWFPSDRLPQRQFWLNQSISGDTTRQILNRLSDFDQTHPQIIYVMAGVNDLKNGATDAEVLSNLHRIILRLHHAHRQADIVVQSILPTRTAWLSSDRVVRLNQQLAAIAHHTGTYYLDVYSSMADPNGNLRPDLTSDGLHLNPKGYATWQSALLTIEI